MNNKDVSLNWYLTQMSLPYAIYYNKELFVSAIVANPENMQHFITDAVMKTACGQLKVKNPKITVNLTGNKSDKGWFVVFAEYPKSFVNRATDAFVSAFAVRGEEVRYFTYELGYNVNLDGSGKIAEDTSAPIYFVSEVALDEKEELRRSNYGSTSEYKIGYFAGAVMEILDAGEFR